MAALFNNKLIIITLLMLFYIDYDGLFENHCFESYDYLNYNVFRQQPKYVLCYSTAVPGFGVSN